MRGLSKQIIKIIHVPKELKMSLPLFLVDRKLIRILVSLFCKTQMNRVLDDKTTF